MCGIAGFFHTKKSADPALLSAMLDAIRHRGPDDQGLYTEGGCGIGMRRLSIIDLNTGHQPIANEDESCWIVFNGEVYNYQGLRQQLLAKGHRFRTNSDTETILHLYEEYGTDCVARLEGMFAFVIWDSKRRQMLLARDRFGKKPLYYATGPAGLHFASEIKCLRAAGIPLEVNEEGLKLYFQFSYIPDPHSAFKGVRKLEPGHWMTYGVRDGSIVKQQYWKLPPPVEDEPKNFDGPAHLEQLRNLFDAAVRQRLIADVPLGAFLSGGIDSSLVVASMAMQSGSPVKTFSVGFEEAAYNELPYARMVAEQYGADHHEIIVKPKTTDLVHKLIHHFDEPFGDSSALPTFIVSEFTVGHVKVALSGDGGDELFGGYSRFAEAPKLERWSKLPGFMRSAGNLLAELIPYTSYGKNYLHAVTRPTFLDRYLEINFSPYHLRRQLLKPRWMLPMESQQPSLAGAGPMSQAEYWEATVNLPGDMLVKVDRMSMAASLEVRCPMLDHHLAEFAAGLPHSWRIRDGKGKYALLAALSGRLPAGILNRPKQGFALPIASWFRGELRPLLDEYLLSKTFFDRGIVNPPFVRHLIDEHQSGRRENDYWLWNLLMLELWFRDYFPGYRG